MRRHLLTLVLTTGTLIPTDAAQLNSPTKNTNLAPLPYHGRGLASGLGVPVRRGGDKGCPPLKFGFPKRRRNYQYTPRNDEDDKNDDDCDHSSDDDPDSDPDDDDQPPFTRSTSTSTSFTPTATSLPSTTNSITLSTIPPTTSPASQTGETNGMGPGGGNPNDPGNVQNANPVSNPGSGGDDDDDDKQNNSGQSPAVLAAIGVVGGLLLIIILLLAWYWFVARPRRRDRQQILLPKNADMESRVTVGVRSGPHTPYGGSSTDGLSSHATSAAAVVPVVGGIPGQGGHQHQHAFAEGAAPSMSISSSPRSAQTQAQAQAEPYAGMTNRPSPPMSHAPFSEAYAVPSHSHPIYSQEHISRSYSSMGNLPQGSGPPPMFPSQGRPSPLQIDAYPAHHSGPVPMAMTELDSRPPPPRYPDAVAAAAPALPTLQAGSGASPTSPLPVSPLSTASPHALTTDEMQAYNVAGAPPAAAAALQSMHLQPQQKVQQFQQLQQQQQYAILHQQPNNNTYTAYQPSPPPEVVSPIMQLGQTSASLPEYDEAAGHHHHHNTDGLVSQHLLLHSQHQHQHQQGQGQGQGDEKQALSSQGSVPRY